MVVARNSVARICCTTRSWRPSWIVTGVGTTTTSSRRRRTVPGGIAVTVGLRASTDAAAGWARREDLAGVSAWASAWSAHDPCSDRDVCEWPWISLLSDVDATAALHTTRAGFCAHSGPI